MFLKRFFVLFAIFFLLNHEATSQQFELGARSYKFEDSKWYNYSSGKKGDEIYPYRLIVRLQDHKKPSLDDFSHTGISDVKNISDRLFGDYYTIALDKKSDPFAAAKLLYESDRFDYVEFDAFFRIHSTPNDYYWNNTWNGVVGQWNLKSSKLDM